MATDKSAANMIDAVTARAQALTTTCQARHDVRGTVAFWGFLQHTLVDALRAERRKVWEAIDDKLDSAADTYFALMNSQARLAVEAIQKWCREQEAKEDS